jgi:hypothetical protein
MNYVEMLMKEYNLKSGDYFGINGSGKYNPEQKIFYFDSNFRLRSKFGEIIHNSMFTKLVTGQYTIIQ